MSRSEASQEHPERMKKTEERPLVSVGIPGPIDARERLLGPFFPWPPQKRDSSRSHDECQLSAGARHLFQPYSTSSAASGRPG
jgi:hypothetical protein